MSLPISLHGKEYFEPLRIFRDAAFEKSWMSGRRRRLGKFVFGQVNAFWKPENGGSAYLSEQGIRIGSTVIGSYPTKLRLVESEDDTEGVYVTTFRMDLDDIVTFDVHKTLFNEVNFREIARSELYRRSERKHELHIPTVEDRILLYTEMQRGATGLY